MLVVLEGPDGAGKTTLAKILSLIMDAEIIHATRETPNNMEWFSSIIEESKHRNIIADRFFWGQFVYQDVDERNLDWELLQDLECKLNDAGGMIVYVHAPKKTLEKRMGKRNEVPSIPVKTMLKKYEYMCTVTRCKLVKYNTKTGKVVYNYECGYN